MLKRATNKLEWIGITLIIFVAIYLICLTLVQIQINNIPVETQQNKIEIVISRYNEDLKWITDEMFRPYDIIIYNKGTNDNFAKPPNVTKIINTDNVGRCDHTYLYHIVKNYSRLSDITIFLSGSSNMDYKMPKVQKMFQILRKRNRAVFLSDLQMMNVKNNLYNFKLSYWESSNTTNKTANPENILEKSKIRPFGKWYESNFGDIAIHDLTYFAIFSIDKRDILQHSLEYYKRLMGQLATSSNPETGHYFQRAWAAVFYPLRHTKIVRIPLGLYDPLAVKPLFHLYSNKLNTFFDRFTV